MGTEERLTSYLDTKLFKKGDIDLLARYLELMQKWNCVYNLTSVVNHREMVVKHILDSLIIKPFVTGKRIIDVGSGAGLPGVPLAIVFPEKQFFLLDSQSKKTRFLTQVKMELKLNNLEIVRERAEKYRPVECFDTVMARAFSSLRDMLEQTKHLGCPKGVFLALKGTFPEEELKAIPEDFTVQRVEPLLVPDLQAERHLVIMERKAITIHRNTETRLG